ncbi:MAG: acriflavin resistance periplasmic protein [uncultured bacterium]|nr:MAG: acriflavin resistance periplasmic protein [uncultured bacterium]
MISLLRSRKIVIVFISIGILFLGFHFLHHKKNNQDARQDALMVDAIKVELGNIPIELQAMGTLVSAKHTEITPEIAGHVAKVFFTDGGVFVKQGTPLVQLDDATFKTKLESDKANLIYSEDDYKRKIFLGKHGAISEQAIDQALADLKTKEAAVKQSQVEVDRMLLTAPFDGVLGEIKVSPGDYVTIGQDIMSLTDLAHLHVEYAVSEKYLPLLKIGQSVKMTTHVYPGKEFTGTIAFISPTINNSDRTISVYAELLNKDHALTAGLFMNVVQELGTEKNTLIIPAASLVPTIEGQEVYKIVNHKAIAVAVTIGQHVENNVQILSGLTAGDVIVLNGQQQLKDGMTVEIRPLDASKLS